MLYRELGKIIREAMSGWPQTARFCVIIAALAGVAMVMLRFNG